MPQRITPPSSHDKKEIQFIMPAQQAELTPAERQRQLDSTILTMLVHEEALLWSVEEIAREIKTDPVDSLERLQDGGFIHRLENYVWATRTAFIADELREFS
ncbi:MAG TPA: hypothetical protein VGL37_04965 [Solirubrobacteraceae bacterium]